MCDVCEQEYEGAGFEQYVEAIDATLCVCSRRCLEAGLDAYGVEV